MFSQHSGLPSNSGRLRVEAILNFSRIEQKPAKDFLIPGIDWSKAVEMALQNGWLPLGTYQVSESLRNQEYGLYGYYMEALDAGNMAAALRRGMEIANKAEENVLFDQELVEHLELWSGDDREIFLTTDLP